MILGTAVAARPVTCSCVGHAAVQDASVCSNSLPLEPITQLTLLTTCSTSSSSGSLSSFPGVPVSRGKLCRLAAAAAWPLCCSAGELQTTCCIGGCTCSISRCEPNQTYLLALGLTTRKDLISLWPSVPAPLPHTALPWSRKEHQSPLVASCTAQVGPDCRLTVTFQASLQLTSSRCISECRTAPPNVFVAHLPTALLQLIRSTAPHK